MSRKRVHMLVIVAVIAVIAVLVSTTYARSTDSAVGSANRAQLRDELARTLTAIESAGFHVSSADVELTGRPAYRIDITTDEWKEYIASIDKATRELAAGRMRGDLALEAAHLAVRNPDGLVVDQYFGIPEYSVSAWSGGNDLMLLQQNRLALLPSIQAKATEFGIEVVSSSLELEDGIQTLNVRARISADIDGKLLEGFVEQMWGMIFARNEDGAQIGVGFFLADGSDGKRLVTEVHDFLIGFRMVHADVSYPPTD